MSTIAFGVWDAFGAYEVASFPVQADIYEQHIREVQLAEALGYRYYFIIGIKIPPWDRSPPPVSTYPRWPGRRAVSAWG
jgi:hypothetical protein